MSSKNCTKCGELKTLDEFFNKKNSKDGRKSECKACSKKRKVEYREKNHEKIISREAELREKNRERIRENARKIYAEDTQRFLDQSNKWRENNREWFKDWNTKYYSDEKNRKTKNLRSKIANSIRRKLSSKAEQTLLDLCGCDSETLKNHLSSLFKDGMTFENYGKGGWEIDHIIPCSKFDLLNEEQKRVCFHYTNLQPLWKRDNLSKSNK